MTPADTPDSRRLVERLRYLAPRHPVLCDLLNKAATALEASLAREKGLREALKTALRFWHEQQDYDEALNVIDEALIARSLEQPETPTTRHSTLCALNATGHRGPCTCGAEQPERPAGSE